MTMKRSLKKQKKRYVRNVYESEIITLKAEGCVDPLLNIHASKLYFGVRALWIYCTYLAVCALKS